MLLGHSSCEYHVDDAHRRNQRQRNAPYVVARDRNMLTTHARASAATLSDHATRIARPLATMTTTTTTRPRAALVPRASRDSTLFALDFDGVVCDSVGESSLSAWKHGVELWPDVFDTSHAAREKPRVLEELRAVRPVVETGYENTTLARALLERLDGYSVDEILADWDNMSGGLMSKWSLDRVTMVEAFGRIRDEWIQTDFDGWLAPNALYPGVAEAVLAAQARSDSAVKIVTTKQARFATAIMAKMGGITIAEEDMFSTTVSGIPKTEVLKTLGVDGSNPRKIFVEDKLSTLEKVCKADGLDDWELFLVDWGYNTATERARAAANPRIEVIGVDAFIALLRSG